MFFIPILSRIHNHCGCLEEKFIHVLLETGVNKVSQNGLAFEVKKESCEHSQRDKSIRGLARVVSEGANNTLTSPNPIVRWNFIERRV